MLNLWNEPGKNVIIVAARPIRWRWLAGSPQRSAFLFTRWMLNNRFMTMWSDLLSMDIYRHDAKSMWYVQSVCPLGFFIKPRLDHGCIISCYRPLCAHLQVFRRILSSLSKADDSRKDQSYILYSLDTKPVVPCPVSIRPNSKTQVREIARSLDLPVADTPDSQDLCFLGDGRSSRNF